jgi:hypothetical protein
MAAPARATDLALMEKTELPLAESMTQTVRRSHT